MRCKFTALLIALLVMVPSLLVIPGAMAAGVDTSDADRLMDQSWNGDNIISLTEELSNISSNYLAYRVSGSPGANEAADFIAEQFTSYGLQVTMDNFTMPVWNLADEPSLTINMDGNVTTSDGIRLGSFNCESFSKPTSSNGLVGELVTLPLPPASNYGEVGKKSIDRQAWSNINITGKVLLIGREVRWSSGWEGVYKNKLLSQPPAAIIYDYNYPWMSYAQQNSQSSSGGLPLGEMGPIFWNLNIPVGSVNYSDGQLLVQTALHGGSVNMSVPTVISQGTHKNVIADVNGGSSSTKLVLFGAHYDTVLSEGYVDNSGGVAAILETARVVQEAVDAGDLDLKYRMRFVAFAGEEMGLVGSLHYVSMHRDEMKYHVASIIADSIGSSDLKVTLAGSDGEVDLNFVADEACARLGIAHAYQDLAGSDHYSFMFPYWMSNELNRAWGKDLAIGRGLESTSTMCVYSQPLTIYDDMGSGANGHIHTSLDSREAVENGEWADEQDLRDQAQVYALMALYAGIGVYEPNYDYLPYVIGLVAVTLIIAFFMLRRWKIKF
ncbi:MAG: M28 family peptidase [Methanomassiliicoccales archaeon]|nr:M28 family peptidase [Methanomassiliicoccales archaeon]